MFLSITNISFTGTPKKPIADVVCVQLNYLYLLHLSLDLIDLRSFYAAHYTNIATEGYRHSVFTACVTLILLLVIIHEERHAPVQPVVTDTVSFFKRIMCVFFFLMK